MQRSSSCSHPDYLRTIEIGPLRVVVPFSLSERIFPPKLDIRPIFFTHVQKTAGVSAQYMLVKALGTARFSKKRLFSWPYLPDIGAATLREMPQEKRDTLKLIAGHFPASFAELFDNPYKTTVLRDPVQRVMSGYFHHLRETGGEYSEQGLLDWASYPFVRNHQVTYFVDHDPFAATIFITDISENESVHIGCCFAEPVSVGRVSVHQRKNQGASLALQCSNDGFKRDITDVPMTIHASDDQGEVTIRATSDMSAPAWRVLRLGGEIYNPFATQWNVVAVRMTAPDGTELPPFAEAISSPPVKPTKPEYCFDGNDAPGLTDMDGNSMTEAHLRQAKRTLDGFDVVGTTDRLPDFFDRIASDTGLAFPEMLRRNAAPDKSQYDRVPEQVRREIAAINSLDQELYRHASALANSRLSD